jgi:hypothetical protein
MRRVRICESVCGYLCVLCAYDFGVFGCMHMCAGECMYVYIMVTQDSPTIIVSVQSWLGGWLNKSSFKKKSIYFQTSSIWFSTNDFLYFFHFVHKRNLSQAIITWSHGRGIKIQRFYYNIQTTKKRLCCDSFINEISNQSLISFFLIEQKAVFELCNIFQ